MKKDERITKCQVRDCRNRKEGSDDCIAEYLEIDKFGRCTNFIRNSELTKCLK